MLHALTIDEDAEVVIDSPDTDVLLLPSATSFRTGKSQLKSMIDVQLIYNKLGSRQAAAILAFHSFTGSDSSGRFAGRTKDWRLKEHLSTARVLTTD